MPSETKERLIEAGTKRFYADGFRNTGIDIILQDVGISKTAFYKHFESKEHLMLAVLERQSQWLQSHMLAMIREAGGNSPLDRLRAVFEVVHQIIESPDFHGCIFVNVAMEFPLPHEPAHKAAALNRAKILEIVSDLAKRAAAQDPEALAEELSLIIDGTYVTRQITNDPKTIEIAKRLAERAIAAHISN